MVRPDDHAPISVMGDHLHSKGGVMVTYRYMGMDMTMGGMMQDTPHMITEPDMPMDPMSPGMEMAQKNLKNNTKQKVHEEMAPESMAMSDKHTMSMEMHMLDVMYGVSSTTNVMATVPVIRNTMNHGAHGATESGSLITRNEGVGDIALSALQSVYNDGSHRVHVTAGVSLPTGDIKQKDNYHSGVTHHPYMMTIGSGTVDLLPAVTYVGQSDNFSWGAQGSSVLRLGENSEGYSFGNRYKATGWGAWKVSHWVSLSSRISEEFWGDVDGMDENINIPSMMADPKSQGGRLLEAGFGFNVYVPEGLLKGHSFGIEAGFPISQDVDDGYGEQQWNITAGWQKSF